MFNSEEISNVVNSKHIVITFNNSADLSQYLCFYFNLEEGFLFRNWHQCNLNAKSVRILLALMMRAKNPVLNKNIILSYSSERDLQKPKKTLLNSLRKHIFDINKFLKKELNFRDDKVIKSLSRNSYTFSGKIQSEDGSWEPSNLLCLDGQFDDIKEVLLGFIKHEVKSFHVLAKDILNKFLQLYIANNQFNKYLTKELNRIDQSLRHVKINRLEKQLTTCCRDIEKLFKETFKYSEYFGKYCLFKNSFHGGPLVLARLDAEVYLALDQKIRVKFTIKGDRGDRSKDGQEEYVGLLQFRQKTIHAELEPVEPIEDNTDDKPIVTLYYPALLAEDRSSVGLCLAGLMLIVSSSGQLMSLPVVMIKNKWGKQVEDIPEFVVNRVKNYLAVEQFSESGHMSSSYEVLHRPGNRIGKDLYGYEGIF